MNVKLFSACVFVTGVAVGVAASWRYFKMKYARIAQEEIDSVKEVFSRKRQEEEDREASQTREQEIKQKKEEHDRETAAYSDMLRRLGYTNDEIEERKEGGLLDKNRPYVIPPDEFGDAVDYDCVSLNFYADGVLTDDWDNPIEDVESLVGKDSLTHFGEYEEDSVFVRNDDVRVDFEILRDERNYYDVVGVGESGPSEE